MQTAIKNRQAIRTFMGLLGNVLLFLVAYLAISAFQTRNMLSASSGIEAPSLSGPLLRGDSFDIASSAGKKPVLVYFFAPWCTFCAVSSDNLVRLRRWRDEDSLAIIAVALDWQTLEEVRAYVDRHDLELPVLLGSRRTALDWHVTAFPTYYVLDSHGLIQRRDLGYSTQLGLWWRTIFVE